MPFLEEQAQLINTALRQGGLTGSRFDGGKFHGLAEQVVESEETDADKRYPVVYNASGEPENVGLDDRYPFIIYHRHRSSTFLKTTSSFGSGNNIQKEEAAMSLVVFGSRSRLKLTPEQLSSLITGALPSEVSASLLAPLKIDTMSLSLNNTNMESLSAFREEYSKVDYPITPDKFLFRISYSITTQYRKDCFNICDCPGQ